MWVPNILLALRHKRFRRLWVGQAFSALGNGITPVALTLLLLGSGRPATHLGWVLGAQSAGLILFVLVGGLLGDRVDRVSLMAVSDVVRLASTLLLAIVGLHVGLVPLMAIAFVLGVGGAMFEPAERAMLPSLVPNNELQAANGLTGVTNRIALILGPPLGAFLVAGFGPGAAFGVDAVTFLISVISLLTLRERGQRPAVAPHGRSLPAEAWEGVRTLRKHPWAAAVIIQGAVQVLLVHAPLTVLAPLVLRTRGELSSYGWLLSLQAVGAVLGALLAGRWHPREPGTVALLAMLGGLPVLIGLVAGFPVPVLSALMILYGAGGSVFAVLWASALQRHIPNVVLARVVSLDYVGQLGLEPVGLAITAPLAAIAGIAATIWASISALLITTAAPFAVTGVRELGRGPVDDGPSRDLDERRL